MSRRIQFSLSELLGALAFFALAAFCLTLPSDFSLVSSVGFLIGVVAGFRVLIDDGRIYVTVLIALFLGWFLCAILVMLTIGPGP